MVQNEIKNEYCVKTPKAGKIKQRKSDKKEKKLHIRSQKTSVKE